MFARKYNKSVTFAAAFLGLGILMLIVQATGYRLLATVLAIGQIKYLRA